MVQSTPSRIVARSLRPTWAEIDLEAIRHNIENISALVGPSKVCAVIKANAYGHGAIRVAGVAFESGCEFVATATVEEGRELREGGITGPILILSGPIVGNASAVVEYELTPTVYTLSAVEQMRKAVAEAGRECYLVHVKVDTGMNRVGAPVNSALPIVDAVATCSELQLEGLFTHFSVADELDDPYTKIQFERFTSFTDEVESNYERPKYLHAANTAAAFNFPETRLDLVRVGIGLYGLAPSKNDSPVSLRPAMTLRSSVVFTKRVPAGEPVGYGNTFITDRETTLATVPVGYADGVPRSYGASGGAVVIGDRRLPVVGSVSMDQLVVDCGDFQVNVGDDVELFGARYSAWEVANASNAIPYEVVSTVSSRVPRRYV